MEGKNILFISAHFFSYENAIIAALKKKGARVEFYNERPSNSLFTKGIIRVFPKGCKNKIARYYQHIFDKIKTQQFDYFLLIKGESVPLFFLKLLKSHFPKMKMLFYVYDTVKEYPKFLELFPYFDHNFSFEPSDVKKYSLQFRPLFFLEQYAEKQNPTPKLYDITFIGTAHTNRYSVGEQVLRQAEKLHLKTHFYYYSPNRLFFLLRRIFDKNLKSFNLRKLSFEKLSHKEVSNIYEQSFAVLDINKPFQFGLSLRTFEVLASGRKLITTNPEITKYPFYTPENILVIPRENIELPTSFFETEFQKSDLFLENYTLNAWLEGIFTDYHDEYWVTNYEKHKV